MNEKQENIKLIFAEALERETAAERAAYLDQACGEDSELRAKIEELLEAHEGAEEFLEKPVLEGNLTLDDTPVTEKVGTLIGPYKLLEKIGEGGMATVYMAQQEKPIRRRVALKIIKLGMDTKQVIARFEVERQALALMDHPNIAKVFDAGTTETGRPFFVMELVRGVSITEYCDKNNLSTPERLNLFTQVCDAVQHAHQKGVIHRDIKPTNIMVTLHDGKPVPVVIDFGIAKATSQRLTEKTLFTRFAQMIGTLEYMSPEQAEMSRLDVDTRTDIYSLGVLLYELLTGATPFDAKTLREAGYIEIQRIIREEDPQKPSTRLSSMGKALTDIAKHRRTHPHALPKLVRGDLDWIVMKMMEKDRTRRYDNAKEVAADIGRHLHHEPVQAGAPTIFYLLRKFIRRHRVGVTAGSAVAAALIVGFVLAAYGLVHAGRERERAVLAEAQRQVAQETAQRSEALGTLSAGQDFVSRAEYAEALEVIEPILESEIVGAEARLLRARCLWATQVLVEEVNQELEGLLNEEAPVAGTTQVPVGEVIQELEGLLDEKAQVAGAAHAILAQIYLAGDPKDEEKAAKRKYHQQEAVSLLPETAEAYFIRAMMTTDAVQETLDLLSKAVELDRSHYPSLKARALAYYAMRNWRRMERDAAVMISHRERDPSGYSLLAIALRESGQVDEALGYHQKAIELSPENPEYYDQQRATYMRMGNHQAALADARHCVRLKSDEDKYHFDVFCHLTALGRFEEAKAMYRTRFYGLSSRYISRILGQGALWYPSGKPPEGTAFLGMVEWDENHRLLSAKAQWIAEGFQVSWSPDGRKLAFSRGVHGFSGVAVYDMVSGETKLLITPGKDPRYSPDGKSIAYVRNRQILPLAHFAGDHSCKWGPAAQEEVWVMNADGTRPRRLAQGGSPSWGSDSRRVFYRSYLDSYLYSVSVDDPTDQKRLHHCQSRFPVVSPDGKYVADPYGGHVKIVELATGSTVTSWDVPTAISNLYVSWSPDGKRLCAGGGGLLGLWEFNIETGEAKKLLGGIIHSATWSSDGHLAIASYAPHEIWIAQAERIGEGQRLEEHYREVIRWATRRSEACTKTARYYFTRARIYRTMGDNEKALASLEELINLYTGRIETKPEVTSNYIYRAKVYQFLGDTEKASADLKQSLGSPFTPSGRLTPIDVQSRANQKLTETLGNNPDDDLRELPRGEQVFGGVKFNIDDALIQLHSQRLAEPRPRKVEGIMINQSFSRLYILHSTGWSVADGTVIGQYKVNYEDKTGETIPIVYGEDVRNWTVISSNINAEFEAPVTRGKLVWIGENPVSRSVGGLRRLYLTLWKNPHPEKKVSSIDFISMMTDAAPFCVAMTVEETAAP